MKFLLSGVLILSAITFTLGGFESSAAEQSTKARPNILLISIDDLNDWVGYLEGHPQVNTPNIDKLAALGTAFTNAHTQSPVCSPSRASMMTSQLPSTTGLYFLKPSQPGWPAFLKGKTMPEVYANNGYHVMGAGKIFHGPGNSHIFKKVGEYGGSFGGFGPKRATKINYPIAPYLWDWGAYPEKEEDMPDYKLAQWAKDKLAQEHEKPFFLAVGFYRPHVPLYVPQKWFDKFPLQDIQLPEIKPNDLDDISQYAKDLTTLKHVSPTQQWMVENHLQQQKATQAYLASIAFVDHYVGEVLASLQQSAYANNTIVVLFSDHGFHMGEKEHWAKRTLWEDGTRVPLIVAGPGIKQDAISNKPVGLLDVFPTLLALTGSDANPSHQGNSFVPLLHDVNAAWEHVALTYFGPSNVAVKNEHWRYITYRDGSQELYDHRLDPNEWNNLLHGTSANKYAHIVSEMKGHIPVIEADVLGENTTCHRAYAAANEGLATRATKAAQE